MISIRGLIKEFTVGGGKVTAIKGLNLDVADGEFFVIVGASGSGKTTLLRCLAGLEIPDGGEIRIAGQCLAFIRRREPSLWAAMPTSFSLTQIWKRPTPPASSIAAQTIIQSMRAGK
ncbi:MAG: ATP-binding cassette domain-containing protein [Deltaproteobacteria bacterium]|nr:ATP-binding cassette domain-containing protein [Deltaproteobacteria bacterium]